nr:unnamed protein product [Callosobruchus analis]
MLFCSQVIAKCQYLT